jgi:hypothetical protein
MKAHIPHDSLNEFIYHFASFTSLLFSRTQQQLVTTREQQTQIEDWGGEKEYVESQIQFGVIFSLKKR